MTIEAAKGGVVARAPGQDALCFARYGLGDRSNAAAELERVAADKTARSIRFVKILAPYAGRRRPILVSWVGHIAIDLGIGVKHQVLANQPARIGEPVREPSGS